MPDIFTKHMQALNSIFSQDFIDAYQAADPRNGKRVLSCLQSIYRRWYYSTLIDNIHFSPANIVSCIGHYNNMPQGTDIVATVSGPASKLGEIGFKIIKYSINDHPVVQDLKCLTEYCKPHIDLSSQWYFTDAQAIKLAKKLSINDPSYSTFLLDIACEMGILERMPSLYVYRMQVSENANAILAVRNDELLHKIINIVIELTSQGLQGSLPAPVPMFSPEGIRDLLTNPQSSDNILEKAFSVLGFDLKALFVPEALDIMSEHPEDYEDMSEVMTGLYLLGIMLDRMFYTPFGYFLRLILPIYSMPFDVVSDVTQYIDECEDEEFGGFYAPCTTYTLTELGLDFFNVSPTEYNYFDGRIILPRSMVDSMAFTLADSIRAFVKASQDAIPISERPDTIYTFRVCFKEDPDIWIQIQMPKMGSLHDLYDEIADAFHIFDCEGYSFFHGETENLFAEYVSRIGSEDTKKAGKSRSPRKKNTLISLHSLDFRHMKHMVLSLTNGTMQKFMLEWMGETVKEPGDYYPKLSNISEPADKLLNVLHDYDEEELF